MTVKELEKEIIALKLQLETATLSQALYGGVVWGLAINGNEWAQTLLKCKRETEATYQIVMNYNDLKKPEND